MSTAGNVVALQEQDRIVLAAPTNGWPNFKVCSVIHTVVPHSKRPWDLGTENNLWE